ncbi:MAG: hypothetical protein GF401_18550 [Chitinivibrionales bacterium]|nr:hypothetical protein [Chitinivibrionales bacterium]
MSNDIKLGKRAEWMAEWLMMANDIEDEDDYSICNLKSPHPSLQYSISPSSVIICANLWFPILFRDIPNVPWEIHSKEIAYDQ